MIGSNKNPIQVTDRLSVVQSQWNTRVEQLKANALAQKFQRECDADQEVRRQGESEEAKQWSLVWNQDMYSEVDGENDILVYKGKCYGGPINL